MITKASSLGPISREPSTFRDMALSENSWKTTDAVDPGAPGTRTFPVNCGDGGRQSAMGACEHRLANGHVKVSQQACERSVHAKLTVATKNSSGAVSGEMLPPGWMQVLTAP